MLLSAGSLVAYVWTAPSMRELSAQGDGFVESIERFRSEHGRYPDSPVAAGFALPETRYGPWRYRASTDRSSFELSVGDYASLDPFTFYWMSETGEWSLDR